MQNNPNYLLAYGERLVSHNEGVLLLSETEVKSIVTEAIYELGTGSDGIDYRLALAPKDTDLSALPEHDLSIGLRQSMYLVKDEAEYVLLSTAAQIATWYYSFQYCPRCAEKLTAHRHERAKICGSCGHHQYPRISPCIIVLVKKGERCLLAHAAKFANKRFSTLAGFIEAGEDAESAVYREVMEEVGIEVQNIQYCCSQSWPFPHSLMLGFTAEYKSGEIKPDGVEILEADWFSADELPILPPRFTIARRLIDRFLADIGAEIEDNSHLFFTAE